MKSIGGKYLQEISIESEAGLTYLGVEILTPNNSSTACTLPTGTNCAILAAEGGDIYYAINPGAGAAAATSPGYIQSGNHWFIGPLSNLTSLKVFGATGTEKAHVEYYSS
jgi:hypothetical protein